MIHCFASNNAISVALPRQLARPRQKCIDSVGSLMALTGRRRRGRGDGAAVADIGIGEREPRLLVVLLLCRHPVEPVGSMPVMTQNEARKNFLVLGPIEGGDQLMTPSSTVAAGTTDKKERIRPRSSPARSLRAADTPKLSASELAARVRIAEHTRCAARSLRRSRIC
jgi:hypothetical protein